jgi:5'-nucleotidase (lipoprotein e(P4) family)
MTARSVQTALAVTLCIATFSISCSNNARPALHAEPGAASPPTAPPAPPASLLWSRSSAEYPALCLQAYRFAARRLEELVRDRPAGSWAVSLDADDTVISNSLYQKESWLAGRSHQEGPWRAWIERQEATAIPGAAEFLGRIRALGGKIAIVTNRTEPQCAATRANLDRLGLLYDALLCRGETGEKEPRWEAVRNGTAVPGLGPLDLVMWVGDNIQDFPDLTQASRRTETGFEGFGNRFVLIPNPMYGSWERLPLE